MNLKSDKVKLLLLAIILLFLVTRFYKISEIPPSLYWDEASIGYNAYAISQTGKDEWGKFLPVHFRAFGEFKLPVYIYATSVSVKLFGLNEFAVRLPAVLFSLGVVILTFLLTWKLAASKSAGLWSSFFITISPWFFIFSRTGYEATAGMMFFLLGVYFFLMLEKKNFFLVLATLSFIISMYSYNSFRIISPLVLIILLALQLKKRITKKILIMIICSLIIFVISLVPIIRLSLFDAGFARTQGFRLFPAIQQVYDLSGKPHLQIVYDRSGNVSWGDNMISVAKNYLVHFSPNFLLVNGDSNPRSQQPRFGEIFFLDILLVIVGLIFIKSSRKNWIFLPAIILFLAPLPAALFKESPHALRSLLAAPFIAVIAGLGANYLFANKSRFSLIFIVVYLFLFANYFREFIFNYSAFSSADWQYGYKEIFLNYGQKFNNFDHVVVSDYLAQPYIFSLYYLKISPEEFRRSVKYNSVDRWGFSTVSGFNNLGFAQVDTKKLPKGNLLVFASPKEKLEIKEKGVIKNLDGSMAFFVYEYENE